MTNLGSISEQTLAGVITTATHGSGVSYGVISTNVMALSLLTADGLRVACSRNENSDLFLASICGLGTTGIILSVQLEVEPAFRLKETQASLPFDDVVTNLDEYAHSAEHVRFWWFPTRDTVRYSAANRTNEVCLISPRILVFLEAEKLALFFSPRTQQVAGGGIHSLVITLFKCSCSSHAISFR